MAENRPFLAYFEDSKEKSRIFKLKKDNPVHAGKTSETITLWVKNITGNELLNIRITVTDGEAEVSPSTIQRMVKDEMIKVTFVWRPKLNRRTALETKIKSFATEVIRPKSR